MRDFGDGSPHDCRERPWKPADADVLIWTSCVKGREGLTGTARGLQPTPRVQRGGRRGPRPGGGEEGKEEKAREHSHLVQCGPLFPGWEDGVGAPFYPSTESGAHSEALA